MLAKGAKRDGFGAMREGASPTYKWGCVGGIGTLPAHVRRVMTARRIDEAEVVSSYLQTREMLDSFDRRISAC